MYKVTNRINIVLHFYNLNSSLTHPLIDLDGDIETEDYTENIRLNYESIFMRQNFKQVYFNCDDKIKSIDSIFAGLSCAEGDCRACGGMVLQNGVDTLLNARDFPVSRPVFLWRAVSKTS